MDADQTRNASHIKFGSLQIITNENWTEGSSNKITVNTFTNKGQTSVRWC